MAVRLALFQMLAVIVGVFMTRAAFKFNGYPDSDLDWNALSLFIRNYGFSILLLPTVWATTVVSLENYGWGYWSIRWTVGTGLLFLLALVGLFLWSYSHPFHWHKDMIGSWGMTPANESWL